MKCGPGFKQDLTPGMAAAAAFSASLLRHKTDFCPAGLGWMLSFTPSPLVRFKGMSHKPWVTFLAECRGRLQASLGSSDGHCNPNPSIVF